MTNKTHYVWCEKKHGNRPIESCKSCNKVPCNSMTAKDKSYLINKMGAKIIVTKLKRTSQEMSLAKRDDNGQISLAKEYTLGFPGVEEREVFTLKDFSYQQELSMSFADSSEISQEKSRVIWALVVRKSGLKVEEIDLYSPDKTTISIIPIGHYYNRQFVRVKLDSTLKKDSD